MTNLLAARISSNTTARTELTSCEHRFGTAICRQLFGRMQRRATDGLA